MKLSMNDRYFLGGVFVGGLIVFFAGLMSIPSAHAQSNADHNTRSAKALEDIAQTLKSIDRKMK